MKKIIFSLLLATFLTGLSSFQYGTMDGVNSSKKETLIKVFTFEIKDGIQQQKFEKLFANDAKFLMHTFIKSKREFTVYCKAVDFTYHEFDLILQEYGLYTKSLKERTITKTQYYKKNK